MKSSLLCSILLCAVPWKLGAADLIISSLGDGFEDFTLHDASGALLEQGDLLQLVIFPGLEHPGVEQLCEQGIDQVTGASSVLAGSSVGAGGSEDPGTLEVVLRSGEAVPEGRLYVLVFDAATPGEASEYALLRLPGELPEDDIGGFDGFDSVHLSQASLVFGAEFGSGLATQAGRPGTNFEDWIAGQSTAGWEPADLSESADPDGDGRSNLVEYATGSVAATPDFPELLDLRADPSGTVVRYLRRANDPSLRVGVEISDTLDSWMPLSEPERILDESVPQGFERVEQSMPPDWDQGYARLVIRRLTP